MSFLEKLRVEQNPETTDTLRDGTPYSEIQSTKSMKVNSELSTFEKLPNELLLQIFAAGPNISLLFASRRLNSLIRHLNRDAQIALTREALTATNVESKRPSMNHQTMHFLLAQPWFSRTHFMEAVLQWITDEVTEDVHTFAKAWGRIGTKKWRAKQVPKIVAFLEDVAHWWQLGQGGYKFFTLRSQTGKYGKVCLEVNVSTFSRYFYSSEAYVVIVESRITYVERCHPTKGDAIQIGLVQGDALSQEDFPRRTIPAFGSFAMLPCSILQGPWTDSRLGGLQCILEHVRVARSSLGPGRSQSLSLEQTRAAGRGLLLAIEQGNFHALSILTNGFAKRPCIEGENYPPAFEPNRALGIEPQEEHLWALLRGFERQPRVYSLIIGTFFSRPHLIHSLRGRRAAELPACHLSLELENRYSEIKKAFGEEDQEDLEWLHNWLTVK